jgi:hypothetical protein
MDNFLKEVLDETHSIATNLYMKSPQISGVVFFKTYMQKLQNPGGVIWWYPLG